MIYYRKDLQKFFLEPVFDNKEVFAFFVKLLNPYLLTTESIAFCVLSYIFKIKVNKMNKKEVIIEYGKNENLTQVEFNCDKKKEFYIGRKQDSDIELGENQISREQAMIYYENDNWYIKDGGERPSGSGTWLFINKKYQIQDSFIFKIGPSKMKIDVNNINNNINSENKEN